MAFNAISCMHIHLAPYFHDQIPTLISANSCTFPLSMCTFTHHQVSKGNKLQSMSKNIHQIGYLVTNPSWPT